MYTQVEQVQECQQALEGWLTEGVLTADSLLDKEGAILACLRACNATLRWAMLNQLRHPPNGFEKVVKAHFYLRRELVRAQLDGWEAEATQPSRISSMVREMKAELDKLDASCLR